MNKANFNDEMNILIFIWIAIAAAKGIVAIKMVKKTHTHTHSWNEIYGCKFGMKKKTTTKENEGCSNELCTQVWPWKKTYFRATER